MSNVNTRATPNAGTRIEFHILQSFPVTCLNRDDVGAPKTAVVGGVTRARVSSQCWKRQVRLALRESGLTMGTRTKMIFDLVLKKCIEMGATPEQAESCAKMIESIFLKAEKDADAKAKGNGKGKGKGKGKAAPAAEGGAESAGQEAPASDAVSAEPAQEAEADADAEAEESGNDTLLFISDKEVETIARAFKEKNFLADAVITQKDEKKRAKELGELVKSTDVDRNMDALDIALFGRMVAKVKSMNVEAAASFAHAISTHKVSNEVEYFTAMDDLSVDQGSSHIGSLEFNSATYYRYVSLDLGQLEQTLGLNDLGPAVAAFTRALFSAVPGARQNTQSGASPWEFARVFVRRGQRLQAPFEQPVKSSGNGFLAPSIAALKAYLDKKEKMIGKDLFGSLSNKPGGYEWGENEDYSVDALIADLRRHVATQAG